MTVLMQDLVLLVTGRSRRQHLSSLIEPSQGLSRRPGRKKFLFFTCFLNENIVS